MSILNERVEQVVRARGEAAAIISDARRITYHELWTEADALSRELRRLGLPAGAAVLLEGANEVDYVTAYLAVVAAGGCVVPVDPRLSVLEVESIAAECRPSFAIAFRADGLVTRLLAAHASKGVTSVGSFQITSMGEQPPGPTLPGDAVVHYSSGSTGTPKGIALTVDNIFHKVNNWNATLETQASDAFLCTLTLTHCFGMYVHTLASLLAGATVYLPTLATITPRRIASLIEKNAITIFGSLPYMFQGLLSLPVERVNLATLRYAISGSAPLPTATARAFAERFRRPINQVYGLTEIGLVAFDKVGDDLESIGRLTHRMQGKIVDAAGRECGADEPGELVVRCESMARGYLNSPDDQHTMFRDGWLWTKDIAQSSRDGRIYLRGRTSQFINVGGNKVAPAEVENVLLAHSRVDEAAVLGRRTKEGGEEVVAFVVLNGQERESILNELYEFCSARLAAYKMPCEISLRQAFPKSPLGKVLKPQLLA